MNYKVHFDGIYSSISKTTVNCEDGIDVYPNFTEAKRVLVEYARSQKESWEYALNSARGTRKGDVKETE